MATGKWYTCEKCGWESGPESMFGGLRSLARRGPPLCKGCGKHAQFFLEFDLGLEAEGEQCEAIAAYLPHEQEYWSLSTGERVEFYPFLVILRDLPDGGKCHWLPYWHLVYGEDGIQTKYGQWAPIMRAELFSSLVEQARDAGHL